MQQKLSEKHVPWNPVNFCNNVLNCVLYFNPSKVLLKCMLLQLQLFMERVKCTKFLPLFDTWSDSGLLCFSPFLAVGRGEGLWVVSICPKSKARRTRASPSEVYPAGKLQWHFTCGFNFRGRFCCPEGVNVRKSNAYNSFYLQ